MRNALLTLTALILTLSTSQAQQAEPNTVRDRLWLFGVPADGPRLFYEGAGYRGGSRITPAEGAHWLGVPNLMFITQPWNQPPAMAREKAWKTVTTKEQYAISFQSLKRVQWAAVGSGGLGGLAEVPDIVTLAKDYPNITSIYLDDFVTRPYTKRADGTTVGTPAMTEAQLKSMRTQLGKAGRPMEVWTTIYTHEFDRKHPDFKDCEPPLADQMKHFDVVVLWTAKSADLRDLEKNLTLLESIKPKNCRIALGIYLWGYWDKDPAKADDKSYVMGRPVPLDLMEHQCGLGLKWLKEGRVSDLVILGLAGIDQGIPSAKWMRDWIKKNGDQNLNR
ncbi:MAG: hypothetical protein RL759_1269 [Verrucomicrobiota bacterium]|jgi:hypothetical protein